MVCGLGGLKRPAEVDVDEGADGVDVGFGGSGIRSFWCSVHDLGVFGAGLGFEGEADVGGDFVAEECAEFEAGAGGVDEVGAVVIGFVGDVLVAGFEAELHAVVEVAEGVEAALGT